MDLHTVETIWWYKYENTVCMYKSSQIGGCPLCGDMLTYASWDRSVATGCCNVKQKHNSWRQWLVPAAYTSHCKIYTQLLQLRTIIYEGCNLPYKVWDWWWCDMYSGNFTIWAGQGMVMRKCTYTCSSLEGRGSGQRHYFLGKPHIWVL
jgi:hypothetical protein